MATTCTFSTACFDLRAFNKSSRTIDQTIQGMLPILRMPVFLVIYTDSTFCKIITYIRELNKLSHMTLIVEESYHSLWCAKFTDKVKSNRESFWPTRDIRTCAESHLLTCNKFDFVLRSIKLNPFNTPKFGWIDMNLYIDNSSNNIKICENYTDDVVPLLLSRIKDDKFHIQIMGVVDKNLGRKQRQLYSYYAYVVCGCFFVCGEDICISMMNRLKQIVVENTELGYGHGEESVYLQVLDEFYNDIERSYGDYGQILNNFEHPVHNIWYIYHNIIIPYLEFGYHKECIECCNKILYSLDKGLCVYDLELHTKIKSICDISEHSLMEHELTVYEYKTTTIYKIDCKNNIESTCNIQNNNIYI